MTYEEALKAGLTAEQITALGIVVPTTTSGKRLLYIADKAYDTVFALENIRAGFTVESQIYKDGSKKTPAGKLVVVENPTPTTPNLRVFCTLRIDGVAQSFMQELSKMNGAGFDTCIDQEAAARGELVVKTGAFINSFNGVVTYSM